MRFIFKFLILFFVCESQCFATSTSFEQNLLFNNNNQSLKMNTNKSIGNFNTLLLFLIQNLNLTYQVKTQYVMIQI